MRIDKTPCLVPQCVLLLPADCLYFHDARRLVDTFTLQEDRDKELTQDIGAALDLRLFPGLKRIKNNHIFGVIEGFICKADQVSPYFSVFFVVYSVDCFIPRISHLL